MPNRSSASSGVVFLDRGRVLADVANAVATLVARRAGVDEDARRPMDRIPEFLLLLQGVDRPVDALVLTAAEWKAREGTALHREVVGHGIRVHPPA